MLLGGLDRQTTVQVLAETELQLARVVPLRQRLGHALTSFTRVGDDLVHQLPEAGQGCFGRLGEPREPGRPIGQTVVDRSSGCQNDQLLVNAWYAAVSKSRYPVNEGPSPNGKICVAQ